MPVTEERLKTLPSRPGVYLYRNAQGEILYVGKAKSLRARVRSYFRGTDQQGLKTRELVRRIDSVETIVVGSEAEALILEANLIKEHRPRFNIQLRDDKRYPHIKVTVQEPFPRVYVTRQVRNDGARYFGPFTSVGPMRQALEVIKRLYTVRSCRYNLPREAPSRPCLDYHIGRCKAPCVGLQEEADYRGMIDEILRILGGDTEGVRRDVEARMHDAAATLDFEEAGRLRDVVRGLDSLAGTQRVDRVSGGDEDVVGLARDGGRAASVVLRVRGGVLLGRDVLRFSDVEDENEGDLLAALTSRYYLGRGTQGRSELPREILLPGDFPAQETLGEVLSEEAGRKVAVRVPRRGEKVRVVELANENARHALEDRLLRDGGHGSRADEALYTLQDRLDLKVVPRVIVCFDISHTQGAETVASAVVFENGEPRKAEYRHMRIKGDWGNDDYRSMEEAVFRYFRRRSEEGRPLPDLALIDGGKGQLGAAVGALKELGLPEVAVAALAKKDEEVFLPGRKNAVRISRRDPALHLLQRLRDEAHRFAVSYNRKLRSRRTLTSELSGIPGVGPGRQKALLTRFGSVRAVKEASAEEIARTQGISHMTRTIRTRFAPSPTGRLHLGNVRTAVFNWLLARHGGGQFVVRLEDTDVDRNVPGSEAGILEDLAWLGLDWDEGPDVGGPFGPYRQSERGSIYRDAAVRLVDEGHAYPCFCDDATLQSAQVEVGEGVVVARYPGTCRSIPPAERERRIEAGEAHLLRLALPEGTVEVRDEIRGDISFDSSDLDDFVLLRRDGRPTYNFAVVVDDLAMEISHVVRGAGHLPNTPKQVALYAALGAEPPAFVHLPTVLGPDRKKLSKRTGSRGVAELAAEGYHPAAVLNYLSLLGWSHPEDREVLTPTELVSAVSLERLGASDTVFDPEKMRWMSQQHLGAMDADEFVRAALPWAPPAAGDLDPEAVRVGLEAIQSRTEVLSQIPQHLALVFPADPDLVQRVRADLWADEESGTVLAGLRDALAGVEVWDAAATGGAVRQWGKDEGFRGPALFHPLRRALTGVESGPDLGRIMEAQGREQVLSALAAPER
jgi:excinuclease ABC subunit C